MAKRRSTGSKKRSSRSGGSRGGYSSRKPAKRSYRASAPRKRTARSGKRASASRGHQTVRIVLETAGQAPVREGEAVGIGQKVAKSPRVKPRF